jgi:hypothetical protein
MGKKAADIGKNVKKSLVSSAKKLIQDISAEYKALEYTKAVDTYIMEKVKEAPLHVDLKRDGKTLLTGNVVWISDKENGGVSIFLDNKQTLYPTPENVKNAIFHVGKKTTKAAAAGILEIETISNSPPCAVCSKPIEILDEIGTCPACGAASHRLHLEEWVTMKGQCNVCQVGLALGDKGEIITT